MKGEKEKLSLFLKQKFKCFEVDKEKKKEKEDKILYRIQFLTIVLRVLAEEDGLIAEKECKFRFCGWGWWELVWIGNCRLEYEMEGWRYLY